MEFVTKPLSSYKLDKSPLLVPLLLSIGSCLEPITSDVRMCNPQGVKKVASQFAGVKLFVAKKFIGIFACRLLSMRR